MDSPADTLSPIHQALTSRDLPRAMDLAERSYAQGVRDPLVLNLCATQREQQGEFDEAIALLQEGLTLAPADLGCHIALGLCLQRSGDLDAALDRFDTVCQLAPELPYGHVNRGRALQLMGRLGEAMTSYDRCLALDPRNPVALAGKARIASAWGQHAEARRYAEQAFALAPTLPDAVLGLASAELAAGALAPAETRLRMLLESGALDDTDRAEFTGTLADVLDAAGRTDEAFRAYESCNAQRQRLHHRNFATRQRALPYVRTMAGVLQDEPTGAATNRAATEIRRSPVFLLGFPRSGTTLLETVLDGNRDVTSLDECELMLAASNAWLKSADSLRQLVHDENLPLEHARDEYWTLAKAAGANLDAPVLLDKNPLNTLKLPLIARLFPGAGIVFAVRDPRDVVFSCYRRRFRMSAPMYEMLSLRGAAEFYSAVMSFAHECIRVFGLQPCFVHHEKLLDDFDGEMSRVCTFLGLEWTADMGALEQRPVRPDSPTPSTAQLASGVERTAAVHWRRYEAHLREVQTILAPWVRRYGYE